MIKDKIRIIILKLAIKIIRKYSPHTISVECSDTGEVLFYRWSWSANIDC